MSTQSQSQHTAGGMLMTLAVLTLIILVAVWYVNLPGDHSFGQKVGSAIDATPQAVASATSKVASPQTAAKVDQAANKVDNTLKKTGDAASAAVAEIGNDLKAAANEQKKQNADHKPDKATDDDAQNTQ